MATASTERYIEAVGRRKTASARVRIIPAKETTITVNHKELSDYFKYESYVRAVRSVLGVEETGIGDYTITVKVHGSGLSAQAEAVRLGIARALVKEKAERRTQLKKAGYLKRDPRSVERKKFGLLKARRRPQWSKR